MYDLWISDKFLKELDTYYIGDGEIIYKEKNMDDLKFDVSNLIIKRNISRKIVYIENLTGEMNILNEQCFRIKKNQKIYDFKNGNILFISEKNNFKMEIKSLDLNVDLYSPSIPLSTYFGNIICNKLLNTFNKKDLLEYGLNIYILPQFLTFDIHGGIIVK